jgi:serralysin
VLTISFFNAPSLSLQLDPTQNYAGVQFKLTNGDTAVTATTTLTPTTPLFADLVFKTANGSIPVWDLNGSQITAAAFTTLGGATVGVPGPDWKIVDSTGDFNGDGNRDLLWQTSNNLVAIWTLNGTQITGANYTTLNSAAVGAPAGWTILGAADFNGDGKSDILWQTGTGGAAIWEMNGAQIAAANYTMQGSTIVGAPGPDWHVIGSGDCNGDGDSDLLWRTDGGALAIWEMNGTQIKMADYIRQGAAQVKAPGPDWHIITTADFDGDGNSDLLWQTNAGQIAIWEMNGTQIKSAAYVSENGTQVSAPSGWKLQGATDVNGDGKADLLWQTPAGQVAVWEMNGSQITGAAYVTANNSLASTPLDWTITQHNYNFV